MIKISRFSPGEYKDIFQILKDEGIHFQTQTETIDFGSAGGYHEYHIFVSKENVRQTIKLLKEYFGLIETTQEPFTGECPACGFIVSSEIECPDCDLSFSPRPVKLLDKHVFMQFLKERGLE